MLHHITTGLTEKDAPAILLINSLGTDLHMWDAQRALLEPHYKVIGVDKPGHGLSETISPTTTMAELGTEIIAVLDHLGVRTCDYIGLSVGGMIGSWLAAKHGERFGRVMLACTSGDQSANRQIWQDRIASVEERGMDAIAEITPARWFTPAFNDRAPETVAGLVGMINACDPVGYVACCTAIRDMNHEPILGEIAQPVLVVSGANDVAIPPFHGERLASLIPNAEHVLLDAPHIANVEAEAAFNAEIERFFLS